jgi:hypothetical protein
MPNKETSTTIDPTVASLLETQNAIMAQLVANQPPITVSLAVQLEERAAGKPKMPCVLYQNGIRITDDMLTHEQCELLKALKPGWFFNRRVRVWRDLSQADAPWNIDYKNKGIQDRLEIANLIYGDFTNLLKHVATTEPEAV